MSIECESYYCTNKINKIKEIWKKLSLLKMNVRY